MASGWEQAGNSQMVQQEREMRKKKVSDNKLLIGLGC
jgi:hypothetical protein